MGRIRTIKPEFFRHEGLFEAEQETGLPLRLAFAGLWTICDREGRFEWKPRAMKLDVMPWDDVDFGDVLDALTTRGFLVRYASGGKEYGAVPSFSRHQVVNNREKVSELPKPPPSIENIEQLTRQSRVATPLMQDQGEGKGREGEREGEQQLRANGASPPGNAAAAPDRVRILSAMGVGPDGVTGPSSFIGTQGDMAEAAKWAALGLSEAQQIGVIAETCQRQRAKQAGWMPKRFSYFTPGMADLAATKASPVPPGTPSHSQADREQQAKRDRWKKIAGAAP